MRGKVTARWAANQFVHQPREHGLEAVVRRIEGEVAVLEVVRDHRSERHGIWGISARNREQNFALNLLLDPEIDFVTILGPAGTGDAADARRWSRADLETNRFQRDHHDARTIPLGEDIGSRARKRKRWSLMGALMDNLEVLTKAEGMAVGPPPTTLLRNRRDPFAQLHAGEDLPQPLHHPRRGAEPTPKQMKALITRAGRAPSWCAWAISRRSTALTCRKPLPG